MTSLSSLPASFPAEKRCKGKHFFSFHQNFFQVFFGEAFRGGRTAARKIPPEVGERCQPFIVQRLSLPKAGAKVRTDSATHSTHFFSSFFDVRGKYAVKQGFTTETFLKGKTRRRKNRTSIYTGVRDYIYLCGTNTGKFLPERTKISIRNVNRPMR